jgi:foldase protein PrsA
MEDTTEHIQPQQAAEAGVKSKFMLSTKAAIAIVAVVVVAALGYRYKGFLVAATVNGSPISRLAIIQELEKRSGKAALDELVTQKLINDEANKKGVAISGDEVTAAIKGIEDQVKAQGQTLDGALAAQGMTMEDFRTQITIQKTLEKLLADKTLVTDVEVEQYIKDNKEAVPPGQEVAYKDQIKSQIAQQKLRTEAGSFIAALRAQASINYFINY